MCYRAKQSSSCVISGKPLLRGQLCLLLLSHKNNIAVNNLYKCVQFLGWASCEMLQKLQLTLWSWWVCLYNLNNKAVQVALDKTERHEQARYSKMQKDPQTPNLLTSVVPFEQDFGKFWESFVFMSVSSN